MDQIPPSSLRSSGLTRRACRGVTADNDLFVAPIEDSMTDYYDADIRASAQAAGQLTFMCETVPTASLMVNVVIFD